ncbi:MAG: hypothetical protein J2P25_16055 [Nocardiopsaceae bacterium]|nr:hypothetical protein [Nocardiopsaceae bacterium]
MPALHAPPDVDVITARALAAPAAWDTSPDGVWVDWTHPDDDEHEPGDVCGSGRWLGIREMWWHAGSGDPGAELWEFLAHARGDVLALAAEVRRLRAELAAVQPGADRQRAGTAAALPAA